MLAQIPVAIQHKISSVLSCELIDFHFISGGCINNGGRLQTSKGTFFLKWNSAEKFPGMFRAEADGLKLLRSASAIRIPDVIVTDSSETSQFLLLEFIEPTRPSNRYWQTLGEQLSALHRNTSSHYGLDYNNYIGSLPQQNTRHQSWVNFFIEERLRPQLDLAAKNKAIVEDIVKKFDLLCKKLPQLIIQENPALLHGDLWSGNLIVDNLGNPCLIDPAVFYGNREAEIAFTTLFGGFSEEFYTAYNSTFPLEKGFKSRIDLYNLYPLLVHLNLFGASYHPQLVSILRKFV